MGGGEYAITAGEAFVWRSSRAAVTLSLASDGWIVEHSTVGRLLGPPQVLHHRRHSEAKHAAWDVMARVQNASKDSAESLRAGQSAARWIKSQPDWGRNPTGNQGATYSR